MNLPLLVLGVCLAVLPAHAAGFSLQPNSPATLEFGGPDGPQTVRFAAAELRRYISRLLGQEVRWREIERNWPGGAYRIRLSAAGASGMPGAPLRASGGDAYRIDVAPDSVTLTASSAASLLSAVYQVLEEQGCRWLFPGAEGEVVPLRRAFTPAPGSRGSRADFSMRGLFPVENLQRYSPADVRAMLDWMARNRLNYLVVILNYGWDRLGPLVLQESRKRGIRVVGYLWSFQLFLPLEVGRAHPEYFAEIDGRRRIDYNVKRCASSPAAIRTYLERGARWFREHGGIDEWIVIPNDGYHGASAGAAGA